MHGRRAEYHANDVRRSLVRAQERDDFRIMSFDSLVEGLAYKHDCYVGARLSVYVGILGDRIIAAELFGGIEPSAIELSETLRDRLLDGPSEHGYVRRVGNASLIKALPWAGERIRT